jgi:hypothetical protein
VTNEFDAGDFPEINIGNQKIERAILKRREGGFVVVLATNAVALRLQQFLQDLRQMHDILNDEYGRRRHSDT